MFTRFILAVTILGAGISAHGQNPEDKKDPAAGGDPTVKFGALFQIWNTTNFESKDLDTRDFNTFRVRRAELKAYGKIGERTSYVVMIDPARMMSSSMDKADSVRVNGKQQVDGSKTKQSEFAVLQDLYITYLINKDHKIEIQVGQFKFPMMYEGTISSGKLNFVERSEIARAFSDKRDLGVMVSAKPVSAVELALMVMNGASQNKTDGNTQKDIAGRVVIKPLEGLSVGGSFYDGYSGNNGFVHQSRWAAEGIYSKGAMTIYAEAVAAKDSANGPSKSLLGTYVGFLYQVSEKWQPGIRYEYAGSHLESIRQIAKHRWTIGVNYAVEKNAKVQLNYVYAQFSGQNKNAVLKTVYLNWQVFF